MMNSPRNTQTSAGSEPVASCLFCRGRAERVIHLTDLSAELWDYGQCRDCGAYWLTALPENLAAYYSRDYYTHAFPARPCVIRTMAIQALLAARYGFPATGLVRCLSWVLRFTPFDTGASRFIDHIENGRVLDVGCGNGDFLVLLRSKGWEAHGIDPDAESVRICHSRGISAIESDAETALLPSDHYDVITLHHSLEHMRNPVKAIRRLARALKPGGKLVIITPNGDGFPARHFGVYWRSFDPPRHTAVATPRALRRVLHDAGFETTLWTTSRNAGWVCRASLGLRFTSGSMKSRPSRLRAFGLTLVSRIAALFHSARGEEIVCVGRRPRSSLG